MLAKRKDQPYLCCMQERMNTTNPTEAVKCWVDLYADELYTWAFYKTGNKETAEDLVQETFLAACQSFSKFEGRSDVKTWIYSILNNKIAGHFRKKMKEPVSGNADLSVFFTTDGEWKAEQRPQAWPDGELLDDAQFREVLADCLKKLPEAWHSALQLKYLEAKKGEVICQELGISPTNFWQVLHRAKLQMRKCLEMHWFKK